MDELIWRVVTSGSGEKHSVEVSTEDGRRLLLTCRAVGVPGAASRKLVGAAQDVTDNAMLRFRALYDPLTGVLNRDGITERVDDALDGDESALLVFVDLDGFKQVNDIYGHQAGDVVLKEVAQRLRHSVRPSDAVGRYGGDEFVIMCHDTPAGTEDVMLARIGRALDGTIEFEDGRWAPRASVGTARPLPGDTAAALLRRADQMMYEDKRARSQR